MNDKKSNSNRREATRSAILPELNLPQPTLEGDLLAAIARYGRGEVRAMALKLTKPPRGRPKMKDWPELRHVIEADAKDWLAGGDPIADRSNYSIAKEYAEKNPGHSAISTHQRIERRLAEKPYDRLWFMLTSAMEMSRDNYPFATHVRALEALAATNSQSVWQVSLRLAHSAIAAYEARTGQPPEAGLTMEQVKAGSRNALATLIQPQPRSAGIFPGLNARKTRDQD